MATIANLIVNVAADTSQIVRGVDAVESKLNTLGGAAMKMAGVLASAFSVQQIVGAAQHVGEAASRIQDLSEKVGISVEAVQRLDFVAGQSGTTFDQVAIAITQMSKRLVGDDKSATAALSAMGLSVSNLRKMAPDEAFITISEAIAKIPDPMRQSATAMAVFGKNGADLLPTIKSHIRDLSDQAPIMSSKLVKAGDEFDDNLMKVQRRLDNLKGQALTPLMVAFDRMPSSLQTVSMAFLGATPIITSLATAMIAFGGASGIVAAVSTAFTTLLPFLGPVGWIAAGVIAVITVWKKWDQIVAFCKGVYDGVKMWLVDKFNAVVDSIKSKVDAVTGFFGSMYDKVVGHSYVPDMVNEIGTHFGRLGEVMVNPTLGAANAVAGLFDQLSGAVIGKVSGMLGGAGQMLSQFSQAASQWMEGLVSNLSAKWQGAVSGIAAGIGAMANGGSWKDGASAAVQAGVSAGLGASMASMAAGQGLAIGSSVALGAATMGIGLAAVGVYQGIKSWMGQRESMAVNDMRDEWFNAHGGLGGVNAAGFDAGLAWKQVEGLDQAIFAADRKDEFAAAIEQWEQATSQNSFASGTGGRFLDFGKGTPAMLHGRERVVTEAEGRREQDMGALMIELLEMIRNLPKHLKVAQRDALLQSV